MTRSTRKFIAVIMLLWLPVFTGSALAASISMQLPQGECQEAAMLQAMTHESMDMGDMVMGEHQMQHCDTSAPAGEHSSCGVCHLACTAYLTVPGVSIAAVQTSARETTPYLVVFNSFSSAPLLPPPLVRA
jgi:hypothetical protein